MQNITNYHRKKLNAQDAERLRNLRLMDDTFMSIVFDQNKEATELLLNVIFDRYDMDVVSVIAQREIKNPYGRSVRLDIEAIDSEGRYYDIEVQRQDLGANERRARYNSSMMDTKLLESGQDTQELPDSYVIFITENDVRKQGRAIYHFRRKDDTNNEVFDDGSHIIYVNAAYKNEDNRIGRLMNDFRATSANQMYNQVLAERVRYFKEETKGAEKMGSVFDEIREEATKDTSIQIAASFLKIGKISHEEIAECTGLTLEEVEELAVKQNV